MSKSVSNLEDHLGFWLRFVSNAVSKEFASSLERQGITVPEWVMLRLLLVSSPRTLGSLGKSTGMTKGAVSKVLDRMLSKALVKVASASNDRRALSIELTSAGRRLVPKLASLADQNDEKFFSCLSVQESTQLRKALQKIVNKNNLPIAPTNQEEMK